MLKIKDNVDLKELEKFGFVLKEVKNFNKRKVNVYCLLDKDDKDDIQFYFRENRTIAYNNYPECRSENQIYDALYDLIKADLVEKVDDKE